MSIVVPFVSRGLGKTKQRSEGRTYAVAPLGPLRGLASPSGLDNLVMLTAFDFAAAIRQGARGQRLHHAKNLPDDALIDVQSLAPEREAEFAPVRKKDHAAQRGE